MLIWYSAGAAAAIAIAWLASLIQASGHAPVGLTSLGVGIALGATLAKIAATLRIAVTRHIIIGTVLLATLTIAAEHTWLYLDFRRQWYQGIAAKPQAALFRSTVPSPIEYFSHELTPKSAALWCLDAALIVASATAAVVVLKSKRPAPNENPQSAIYPTPDT